jgi:hypothetical protein
VHGREIRERHRLADVRKIDRLSARHPRGARGVGEQRTRFRGIGRSRRNERREGLRLQRIAREQRRRLAEGDVARRLATAEHVVVHARQVVVCERVRVNHLHGGRRPVDGIGIRFDELAGGVREKRPHPLASAEHRIAHCLDQPRRLAVASFERSDRALPRCVAGAPAPTRRTRGQGASSPPLGENVLRTPRSNISICCCASLSADWQKATSSAPRLYAASDFGERQLLALHGRDDPLELGEGGFEVLGGLGRQFKNRGPKPRLRS